MKIDDLQIWSGASIADDFGPDLRIALVGNGPVEPEDRKRLDECNVVVRFNNWGSRKGDIVDKWLPILGGRCDIVVSNCDVYTMTGRAGLERPKQFVLAIPYPHRWDSADRLIEQYHSRSNPFMVNPFWNRDLCAKLGYNNEGCFPPIPTVGLTAIYHLWRMTLIESLDASFFVCGFTWQYDSSADEIQGHDVDVTRLPEHFNHSYAREADWVANSIYGLNGWTFSDLAKWTLDRFRGNDFRWRSRFVRDTLLLHVDSVTQDEQYSSQTRVTTIFLRKADLQTQQRLDRLRGEVRAFKKLSILSATGKLEIERKAIRLMSVEGSGENPILVIKGAH